MVEYMDSTSCMFELLLVIHGI